MASARIAPFTQSPAGGFSASGGISAHSRAPITRPATPIPSQNVLHATPAAITGPTANWPAEPPAMPNICVAPISVAAREAGKCLVAT